MPGNGVMTCIRTHPPSNATVGMAVIALATNSHHFELDSSLFLWPWAHRVIVMSVRAYICFTLTMMLPGATSRDQTLP
eukprot:scaffold266550_cov17-Prasinocladus_malaysianus.AAC.1